MRRKFKLSSAVDWSAFITDEDGYVVAVLIRLGDKPQPPGYRSENPLTTEEWQALVDQTLPLPEDLQGQALVGTTWKRESPYDPEQGPFNYYTVLAVTNLAHQHERHPPQVVYKGSNGNVWSLPLAQWPGKLIPHTL